jgi:predicted N-acyltransferase
VLQIPKKTISVAVYESIADCDAQDWDAVIAASGAEVYISREFLAAIEDAHAGEFRFLYALAYEAGRPVACASFCTFPIDPVLMSDGAVRQIAKAVSKVAPFIRRQKIIMCGPPASVGGNQLAIVPDAPREEVLRALHEAAVSFARREGANFVAFKELLDAECEKLEHLAKLGYGKYPSVPTHKFDRTFSSFDGYCKALRSKHRYTVKKSIKKARAAGLRHERITDPDAIVRLYTPELHRLYEQVVLSAKTRMELLPISFFHALARRMAGKVGLMVFYHEDRIVGYCWNVNDGARHYGLFAGVDRDASPELDLYFNMLYADMEFAFASGAKKVSMGQAADTFKARLGCVQLPLWFYLAPLGPIGALMIRLFSKLMFPTPPPAPVFHAFSGGEGASE